MREIEQILEELEEKKKKCLDIVKIEIDPVEITIHREQYKGMRMAEDIIRKHANDGWIPVEERLPKVNTTYNVTRYIDGHFISDSAYFDGQNTWHSDNRVNHARPYLTDVIAWQPLPEPYRPEKGTEE